MKMKLKHYFLFRVFVHARALWHTDILTVCSAIAKTFLLAWIRHAQVTNARQRLHAYMWWKLTPDFIQGSFGVGKAIKTRSPGWNNTCSIHIRQPSSAAVQSMLPSDSFGSHSKSLEEATQAVNQISKHLQGSNWAPKHSNLKPNEQKCCIV